MSADAMTASALSDPTDGSSEPWLRRVAAADPLFDPVGGFARVDTYAAPILFADSARAGAVSLSLSTRIAAADMRSGGCRAARQAVIVGGTAAVPAAAESELVALGFAEVFRVAGAETPDGAGPFGVSTVRGLPLGAGAYATTLSMSPVYRHSSTGGVSEAGAVPLGVCLPRASYANARWLVAETGADTSGLAALGLSEAGWYLADGDGVVRSTATGTPSCLDVDVPAAAPLVARAVSSVGRTTRSLLVAAEPQRRMSLWGPVRARFAQASGVRSDRPLDVGVSTWEFATGAAGGSARLVGEQAAVAATKLTAALRRRPPTDEGLVRAAVFAAEWSVRTERGRPTGTAQGEARFAAGQWELRGASVLRGGTWASSLLGMPGRAADTEVGDSAAAAGVPAGSEVQLFPAVEPLRAGTADGYGAGGFTATLTVNGQDNLDDIIRWQPEAVINTRSLVSPAGGDS